MSKVKSIPGFICGEPQKLKSPAKISEFTSSSQPSFTPSKPSTPKKAPLTGVGNNPHVDGGLLIALADEERGGVDGKLYIKEVSRGIKAGDSCCTTIVGFADIGLGDAIGVMFKAALYGIFGCKGD